MQYLFIRYCVFANSAPIFCKIFQSNFGFDENEKKFDENEKKFDEIRKKIDENEKNLMKMKKID